MVLSNNSRKKLKHIKKNNSRNRTKLLKRKYNIRRSLQKGGSKAAKAQAPQPLEPPGSSETNPFGASAIPAGSELAAEPTAAATATAAGSEPARLAAQAVKAAESGQSTAASSAAASGTSAKSASTSAEPDAATASGDGGSEPAAKPASTSAEPDAQAVKSGSSTASADGGESGSASAASKPAAGKPDAAKPASTSADAGSESTAVDAPVGGEPSASASATDAATASGDGGKLAAKAADAGSADAGSADGGTSSATGVEAAEPAASTSASASDANAAATFEKAKAAEKAERLMKEKEFKVKLEALDADSNKLKELQKLESKSENLTPEMVDILKKEKQNELDKILYEVNEGLTTPSASGQSAADAADTATVSAARSDAAALATQLGSNLSNFVNIDSSGNMTFVQGGGGKKTTFNQGGGAFTSNMDALIKQFLQGKKPQFYNNLILIKSAGTISAPNSFIKTADGTKKSSVTGIIAPETEQSVRDDIATVFENVDRTAYTDPAEVNINDYVSKPNFQPIVQFFEKLEIMRTKSPPTQTNNSQKLKAIIDYAIKEKKFVHQVYELKNVTLTDSITDEHKKVLNFLIANDIISKYSITAPNSKIITIYKYFTFKENDTHEPSRKTDFLNSLKITSSGTFLSDTTETLEMLFNENITVNSSAKRRREHLGLVDAAITQLIDAISNAVTTQSNISEKITLEDYVSVHKLEYLFDYYLKDKEKFKNVFEKLFENIPHASFDMNDKNLTSNPRFIQDLASEIQKKIISNYGNLGKKFDKTKLGDITGNSLFNTSDSDTLLYQVSSGGTMDTAAKENTTKLLSDVNALYSVLLSQINKKITKTENKILDEEAEGDGITYKINYRIDNANKGLKLYGNEITTNIEKIVPGGASVDLSSMGCKAILVNTSFDVSKAIAPAQFEAVDVFLYGLNNANILKKGDKIKVVISSNDVILEVLEDANKHDYNKINEIKDLKIELAKLNACKILVSFYLYRFTLISNILAPLNPTAGIDSSWTSTIGLGKSKSFNEDKTELDKYILNVNSELQKLVEEVESSNADDNKLIVGNCSVKIPLGYRNILEENVKYHKNNANIDNVIDSYDGSEDTKAVLKKLGADKAQSQIDFRYLPDLSSQTSPYTISNDSGAIKALYGGGRKTKKRKLSRKKSKNKRNLNNRTRIQKRKRRKSNVRKNRYRLRK